MLALLLSACAGTVRIQPLATGRVDVAAYQLQGPDLDVLSQEAKRLCPAGQQVLRQSQSGTRQVAANNRWQAVLYSGLAWVDPPSSQADMMVVCMPLQPALAQPAPLHLPEVGGAVPVSGPGHEASSAMPLVATAATTAAKQTPVKPPRKPVKPEPPAIDELDLAAEPAPRK